MQRLNFPFRQEIIQEAQVPVQKTEEPAQQGFIERPQEQQEGGFYERPQEHQEEIVRENFIVRNIETENHVRAVRNLPSEEEEPYVQRQVEVNEQRVHVQHEVQRLEENASPKKAVYVPEDCEKLDEDDNDNEKLITQHTERTDYTDTKSQQPSQHSPALYTKETTQTQSNSISFP